MVMMIRMVIISMMVMILAMLMMMVNTAIQGVDLTRI